MPNPIEDAREAVAAALATLPDYGLRTDWALRLKKYEAGGDVDPLDQDPDALEEPPIEEELLDVPAPKVKPVGDWVVAQSGGLIEVGDLRLTFPRSAAVEAFLDAEADPDGPEQDRLFPAIERVIFELNGLDYRPIRWVPGTIFLEVYVRRIS